MLISSEEINKVLQVSGNLITVMGKKYFERDKVKITYFKHQDGSEDYFAKSKVEGTYLYNVEITKKEGKLTHNCNCPYSKKSLTPCKHIIATMFDLYINEDKYLKFESLGNNVNQEMKINAIFEYREKLMQPKDSHSNLLNYYENLELGLSNNINNVEILPILELPFKGEHLFVRFKLGKDKMYILKDIYEFGDNLNNGLNFSYGKKLEFKHTLDVFNKESKGLAKFIKRKTLDFKEYKSLSEYFKLSKEYKNKIKLKYSSLDNFFELMVGKNLEIEDYDVSKEVTLLEEDPVFSFDITNNEDKGIVINKLDEYIFFQGEENLYVLYKDKLYKTSLEYKAKMSKIFAEFNVAKNKKSLEIPSFEATSFCEYVLPNLKEFSTVKMDEDLIKKYRAKNLGVKIYLDINNLGNIIANVKFCYDEVEFNPFNKELEISCNRNFVAERKTLEIFKDSKFIIDYTKQLMYISNNDHIYSFLTEDLKLFMEKFEVLATEKLKNKQIINSKSINIGLRIENNLLNLDFEDIGISENELKEIFKRYSLKKKYFRLKDGSYINIDSYGMKILSNLNSNLGISEKDIISGNVKLPKYRVMHLDKLVEDGEDLFVTKDKFFKKIVSDINKAKDLEFELPQQIESTLRPYQKTGFNWIKTLERYGFGGILADDMGLGKTIQVIAILLDEKNKKGKTSIVVCPSSLYINWQKEITRFAPNVKTLIISGDAAKREKLIKESKGYDVIITSYDLLKRDIEKYEKIKFKYIIADEAQYIKNNNTKNAKSIKNLNGEVRLALTGTPMENSFSELWSIFDFVMPGYLFSNKVFKNKFEKSIIKDDDKEAMDKLRKMVSPFILRRIKKEVLKELPDKTETIMYSQMDDEQEKIYKSYLKKAKEKLSEEIEEKGFEKSRIKILSIITRLRQICCHPALFLDNYTGESSKLNQCMEIIKEAVGSGHKILLFSQFTSMFNIIIPELEKLNITHSILTGKTKVDTRIEMVDEFNRNKDISIFLISLKAGGTGLNLTGADIVIHYDPWWNLSAQNQATDRAHRIGQKSNVQVFKLITSNSIEEKIKVLQDKKMDLTNSVIKSGELFINKMSKDEILDLFEN